MKRFGMNLICGVSLFALVGCSQEQPAVQPAQQSPRDVEIPKQTEPVVATTVDDESFLSLKGEFDTAFQTYREECRKQAEAELKKYQEQVEAAKKASQEAQTGEEKRAAQTSTPITGYPGSKPIQPSDGPGEIFSPRFLAFAVKHPQDDSALDALHMALITSGGPTGPSETWASAIKALQTDHVRNPGLRHAVRLLRDVAGVFQPASDSFLRDVIEQHPDRKAQARACQALANGRERAAAIGERLAANANLRLQIEAGPGGKEFADRLVGGVNEAKRDAEELSHILHEKYNDVCPDLSIGQPAPEVVSQDLDGNAVKLSELKGNVVVLDIWATWCGPCRAMIPHEREMVARLSGKPFVLVSISTDEDKESLTDFLAKEQMPWTHWWNGHEGGIVENWNIEAYPTIYVLDAKGTIRYEGLRGENLEEAVNQLIAELEAK